MKEGTTHDAVALLFGFASPEAILYNMKKNEASFLFLVHLFVSLQPFTLKNQEL